MAKGFHLKSSQSIFIKNPPPNLFRNGLRVLIVAKGECWTGCSLRFDVALDESLLDARIVKQDDPAAENGALFSPKRLADYFHAHCKTNGVMALDGVWKSAIPLTSENFRKELNARLNEGWGVEPSRVIFNNP